MGSDYEAQVNSQVEKLSHQPHAEIQARVALKRLAWLEQKFPGARFPAWITPRAAFELLFFDYMGLPPESLEIIVDSKKEITWISRNPCPTLGACAVLGLDTRVVCRAAYEKSTQAFLSRLDPQLRFLRSYQEIRPYADGCKESILRVDFARMMAAATKVAGRRISDGGAHHGAVIALGRKTLVRAGSPFALDEDSRMHAENFAISLAVKVLGDANLSGAILFATQRPCTECFSLAEQANLTAIVFPSIGDSSAPQDKTSRYIGPFEIVE